MGMEYFVTCDSKCCGGAIAILILYFFETSSAVFTNFIISLPDISS